MTCLFHVSSALNRESILAHGLDWTRMGGSSGYRELPGRPPTRAGSCWPERVPAPFGPLIDL